jgi:hypothetical protein
MESVIRRLPNSLCPPGKNPSQYMWYKWSLLKVRERKYKREYGRVQVESEGRDFSSPGALKIYAGLWEGRNQVISIQ